MTIVGRSSRSPPSASSCWRVVSPRARRRLRRLRHGYMFGGPTACPTRSGRHSNETSHYWRARGARAPRGSTISSSHRVPRSRRLSTVPPCRTRTISIAALEQWTPMHLEEQHGSISQDSRGGFIPLRSTGSLRSGCPLSSCRVSGSHQPQCRNAGDHGIGNHGRCTTAWLPAVARILRPASPG